MTASISYQKAPSGYLESSESNISLSLESLALRFYRPMHLSFEIFSEAYFSRISNKYLFEKAKKIALVFAAIIFFPLSLVLWGIGGAVDAFNFCMLNQKGFSVFKGQGEVENLIKSIFSLNSCMLFGPLPSFFGGVSHSFNRIDQLSTMIHDKKPDVVFLQEMSRPAAELFWGKIKQAYTFAVSSISPQPWILMDSGLFAAFKTAPLKIEHLVLPTNKVMKGSVILVETRDAHFLTTHLEAGQELEDKKMRQLQIKKIIEFIDSLENQEKPLYLFGDFNLLRTFEDDCEYQKSKIQDKLFNLDSSVVFNEDTATCTNFLTAYLKNEKLDSNKEDELIDYAFIKNIDPTVHVLEKVASYDKTRPREALSDHKGLFVTICS